MDSPEAKSQSSSYLESSPSRGDADYNLDTDRRLIFSCERVEKQLAEVEGALDEISLDDDIEDLINSYSDYRKYLDDVYWTHDKMGDEEPLFEYEIGKLKKKTPTSRCLKPTALNEEEREKLKKGDKVIKMRGKNEQTGTKYKLVERYDKGELHEEYATHLSDLENEIKKLEPKSQEYVLLRVEKKFLLGIKDGDISDDLYEKAQAMELDRLDRIQRMSGTPSSPEEKSPSSSPKCSPSKLTTTIDLAEKIKILEQLNEVQKALEEIEKMMNVKKHRDNAYWTVKNQMTKEKTSLFESDMRIFKDGKATALDEAGRKNLKPRKVVFAEKEGRRSTFKYILVKKYDKGAVDQDFTEDLTKLTYFPNMEEEYNLLVEEEKYLDNILRELENDTYERPYESIKKAKAMKLDRIQRNPSRTRVEWGKFRLRF